MAGQRSKVQEDIRFRVLRLLEENPEMSQLELAEAVGVSTGSANYMLKALVEIIKGTGWARKIDKL
ncbi:winged helix-turn-helix transcriptional regulator [Thioclava sp. F36-6]|uniref:winged helix-turn-helix transcriptional regulator n=1 Tax=Thioclava sp. F36-6 TaxID=1915316 RepID=UPI0009971B9D|nr:winged helix-turn-helix transcriptional regulator [Thioclava sp. F36-6]OOY32610.1 hypothetical protein BMI88_01605 [Thioclava sp. F36-6]